MLFISLQENLEFFKADGDSDIWKAYVDYVDEMIVDGFFNTIHCSLKFMLDNTENTESRNEFNALFEALLELQVPEMVFNPSLDAGVADSFYDLIDSLVGDIYKQASKVHRLALHSGQEHYQVCGLLLAKILVLLPLSGYFVQKPPSPVSPKIFATRAMHLGLGFHQRPPLERPKATCQSEI